MRADDRRALLASAAFGVVCEYLTEIAAPGSHEQIQANYEQARSDYERAHQAAHDASDISDPWDPQWSEVCRTWEQSYIPEMARAMEIDNIEHD